MLLSERPCELLRDGQKLLFGGLNIEERKGCRALAYYGVRHGLQPNVVWL